MQTQELSRETIIVLPTTRKEKYLFTIEEALALIVEKHRYWMLYNMLYYNIPIRDAIRSKGIQTVIETLLDYAPNDDRLRQELDNIVSKEIHVSDFDIQMLPITCKLNFFGHQTNLKQIAACVEIIRRIGRWTSLRERKDDTFHVAEVYEPYPCFDSFDYASENRDYENYFIRDRAMTEADCLEIENCFGRYCRFFASNDLPEKYLPVIYRDGDSGLMYVATAKNNPQLTPEELAREEAAK